MKRFLNYILSVVCLFIFIGTIHSQVSATSEVNRNEIRIGEPILLNINLRYTKQDNIRKVHWPNFKDTITKQIEIISSSKIDTIQKNDYTIIQQTLSISAYDSGQFVLPAIKFYFNDDTAQSVRTNSLIITVHTVPTDTSEISVKDIKPILEESFDIKWYMPLIIKTLIGLIILAIVIYLIYRYFKKKPKEKKPEKPKLPPHILALEKLNKIKEDMIWKEGKVKEYYSDIADTLREYIEGRYKIPALEQTTHETLKSLGLRAIDVSSKEKIKYVLELSDLVKFAKFIPIEHDHQNILEVAFDFVNQTKPDYSTTTTTDTPTNTNPKN